MATTNTLRILEVTASGRGGVSFVDEGWISANFAPDEDRTREQRAKLAESDALLAELQYADVIVIGAPIYNFGIPASLKAWVDMIARARVTFRYTENGPEGLLKDKKAVDSIDAARARIADLIYTGQSLDDRAA